MIVSGSTGYLARHPEADDSFALVFDQSKIEPSVVESLISPANSRITILGRSALGQVGLDFFSDPAHTDGDRLWTPIDHETHSLLAERLIEDVHGLPVDENGIFRHNNEPLPFARVLDEAKLQKLSKEEVKKAVQERLVVLGAINGPKEEQAYIINEDGSITLPLAQLEFLFNQDALNTPEKRLDIFHHGRAGLRPYVDTAEREADETLSDFTVSGVLFSAGPYFWTARRIVSDGEYMHLDSVRFGDGNRIMGIGNHLPPYERHRQVELAWGQKTGSLTFGDAKITIDLFKKANIAPKDMTTSIDWSSLSATDREKIHRYGLEPLRVLRATDPALLEYIYGEFADLDLNAAVVSPYGVTGVEVADTPKFNAQNISDAVSKIGSSRGVDDRLTALAPISERLSAASDRSRVVIARDLDAKYAPRIVEERDVRGLIVQNWGSIALSKEAHAALTTLVRKGTSIGWYIEQELRQLHQSGLWVKPGFYEQLGDLEAVIAMYGGHKDAVGHALSGQINNFIGHLPNDLNIPAEQLAVAHGNGPGVMLAAHLAAQANRIMSIGVSIDVESLGQKVNLDPDAVAFFESRDRLYRQNMLDIFNTISIFNIGGYGTLEEFFITLTSQKLYESLPVPKILIQDESAESGASEPFVGLYSDIPNLVHKVSNTKSVKSGGQGIDLQAYPLGPSWVPNTIHLIDNYREALRIIAGFMDDPASYWRKAGISKGEIAISLLNQTSTLETVGFNPNTKLARAAARYSKS
jgi:hypothetical protein